jgi:pyruvate kinase
MSIGDLAVFDDGKMTATVREIYDDYKVIECTEISGGKEYYTLKGKKGICVRNKPLGIDCITEHDHKSLDFAKNILGFDAIDNIMVSYFLSPKHIEDFIGVVRGEYGYTGNLGAKFETPFAVNNVHEILATGNIQLAMFGRGDLRVEMDLRAIPNMHDIQVYFFEACKQHNVESICATGFLESMMTPDGCVEPSEIGDMQISMQT